jgi:catechol 2,3-dioxygenase-like lactoylglutathione lyase family enzyme
MFNQISNLLAHYETGQLNRRDLIFGLAALAATPKTSAQSPSSLKGLEINHVALNVTDVQRSRDFYQALFDLPVLDESPTACFLGLGEGNFLSMFQGNPGLNHYCIGIGDYETDSVIEELRRQGLEPRQRDGVGGPYFDDPDGLVVQLEATGYQEV